MTAHDATVSVIVPTYKRAHLIEETLLTYLQENVIELIVIDDCSPDDTAAVVRRLITRDSRIRYFRQAENLSQTAAKNRGKALARGQYIYFGDDDSVLLPGSIRSLLETASQHPGSIIGASAVYMNHDETSDTLAAARRTRVQTAEQVADLKRLRFEFDCVADKVLEVPVCHASFLIETRQAARLDFDRVYRGNAYREETDFLLRSRALGQQIFLDTRAVQVNLPAAQATGGARKRFWRTEYFIMANTWLLIKRNQLIIRQLSPDFSAPAAMLALLGQRIGGVIRRNRARGRKLWKMLSAATA